MEPAVVSYTEALRTSTPKQIRCRLAGGHWHRLTHGYYWTGPEPPPLAARAAALLRRLPDAVVSHRSAALLQRLDVEAATPDEPVHLTRRSSGSARTDVVWHRGEVAPAERWSAAPAGLAVSGPERTVADLLLGTDRLTAIRAAESLLRRDPAARTEVAVRFAHRLRSAARAAQWLALAEPGSESPLETALRLLLCDAGLPAPAIQYEVRIGRAFLGRLDMAWPQHRVAVEADGRAFHDDPQALYRDRDRQNALLAAGWLLLRFTWWDVHHRPEHVVAAVRVALASGWRLAAPG